MSVCGNGRVESDEACDDGNTETGDGCSSTCAVEPDFTCVAARCADGGGNCTLTLPVTFRDFNAHLETGGHPDFQPGVPSNGAVQGLLEAELDTDGKPVLAASANLTATYLHGPEAFAEWYRDEPPSSGPIEGTLVLWGDGNGRFVNRWGAHGEGWQARVQQSDYGNIRAGLSGGLGCSSDDEMYAGQGCTPAEGEICYDPCTPWGLGQEEACCAGIPTIREYDGNPLFFPIDDAPGILSEKRLVAQVPAQYGWSGWPNEDVVAKTLGVSEPIVTATAPFPSATHNFSFTTELTYWFRYDASKTLTLDFIADDDMWVFLNGHLAVDLGGYHVPLKATLTLDPENASVDAELDANDSGTATRAAHDTISTSSFELTDGGLFALKIFHAEREAQGSAFGFGFSGIDVDNSVCVPAP